MQPVRANQTPSPGSARRLGGGDIGVCLTRLHHDRFSDSVRLDDDVRSRDAKLGFAHEARVLDALTTTIPGTVRIPHDGDSVAATIDTLASGAPLVLGARLVSQDGESVGAPDILILLEDGYAPIEVKNHKTAGSSGLDAVSTPLDTITEFANAERTKMRSNRRRDLLQVTHYRRLLSEIGHASLVGLGGVIGSDQPYRCLWVELDVGDPSIQDEYDGYLTVASDVIAHGRSHPDDPLESPWWRTECRRCDWASLCKSRLETANDPTLLSNITAAWRDVLGEDGVTTVDQIAAMDPSDDRVPGPAVVFQARARSAGQLLRFDSGTAPLEVPTSTIEADFDIETYNGQIYLAGFLLTSNGSSSYEPIVDWTGDLEGERDLVERMFARLAAFGDEGTIIQHWTDYERRTLVSAGRRHGLSIPRYHSIDGWFDAHAVDLCDWTRRNLVSPNGYSLKVIAPLCGFEWRDDDPGGRQSEIWFERLVAGDASMRDRLLEYNEDDVVAQREIRQWVRRHDAGTGPGSAIPSVHAWPLSG